MKTYDNGTSTTTPPTPGSYLSDWTTITQNTSTANSNLGGVLINDAVRYLATEFYFNEKSYTTTSVAQQQAYALPTDFEQMENVTVTIGTTVWQGKPSSDRRQWDMLNTVPYYNDYPQYLFIWQNQLLIWPIPASSSNTITMNYKSRIPDMSMADVTGGTVSVTTGTTAVTGSGTSFASWMGQSGWIKIAHSTGTTSANGDGRWYQIASVASSTALTLTNAYLGATVSGGTARIGDVCILGEDYQDIPLYRALYIYYASIAPDATKSELYKNLYDASYAKLQAKYGSKDYSPVLTDTQAQTFNPNLFPRSLS